MVKYFKGKNFLLSLQTVDFKIKKKSVAALNFVTPLFISNLCQVKLF